MEGKIVYNKATLEKIILLFFLIINILTMSGFSQDVWNNLNPESYAWKNVGTEGFVAFTAKYSSLAMSPLNEPYVAYSDGQNYAKAKVKKFDGNNWITVGSEGFSNARADYINLAFNPTDSLPYVVYEDWSQSYKTTVMKFEGANWVNVGNIGFSAGACTNTTIGFGPGGDPYVAYTDYGNGGKVSVMRFDGNAWIYVGNPGFSPAYAEYTNIAFSPSGEPHVAFACGDSAKACVMKFTGTQWTKVGTGWASWFWTRYSSLTFSPTGVPYLAFGDAYGQYVEKASVKKFNGTSWEYVGPSIFSQDQVVNIDLVFSPSGELYVAFGDTKATVMKFNGTKWIYVGEPNLSPADAFYTNLAVNEYGTPFLAYVSYLTSNHLFVKSFDSVYVNVQNIREPDMKIYPNPSENTVIIDFKDLPDAKRCIELYDAHGIKKNEYNTVNNKCLIDVQNYPAGMYFIKVKSENTVYTRKLFRK